MIFNFIRYVSPTWYFNLKPKKDHLYFPGIEQLKEAGLQIDVDTGYTSLIARQRDLAWCCFQKGLILSQTKDNEAGLNVWEKDKIPVIDEYRFIKKYYNSAWSLYILCIRILTLKNPIRELNGYLKNRGVKRENLYGYPIAFPTGNNQNPFSQQPLVSVIIPTLNRYGYLKDVLDDLANQSHNNIEVIVVDQSEPFQKDFYKSWTYDIKVMHQEEKALWLARNTAIKMAQGELILLYDDDSRVENDWIEQHIRCLVDYNADISSGVSISKVGAKVPENYKYFRWSDQIDTGNVMIKRDVFREIGLFDRQFEKQRMGDGEYGLRAYLAGYRNISNPLAKRLHLKAGEGGLRQMGSWDAFRPKKLLAPRPIPSVLYLFKKYFGNKIALLAIVINLPPSIVPYKYKGDNKKLIFSIFISLFLVPLLIIQVIRSWIKSDKMLREGNKIEILHEI